MKLIARKNVFIAFIVIGICSILIGLSFISKEQETNEWDNRYRCRYQMTMIKYSLLAYAKDHNGVLPSDFQELFPKYATSDEFFVCPSRWKDKKPENRLVSSYRSNMAGKNLNALESGTILLEEVPGSHPEFRAKNGGFFPRGHHVLKMEKGIEWVVD